MLNLNVLASALTWQFVVLGLTSVIVISLVSGFVGRLFGLYPVESAITAGLCNNSMGGTGNVAVLSAANRMELIAFAQMGESIRRSNRFDHFRFLDAITLLEMKKRPRQKVV